MILGSVYFYSVFDLFSKVYCTSIYFTKLKALQHFIVTFLASYLKQTPCQCRVKITDMFHKDVMLNKPNSKRKKSCVLFSFTVPEFKIYQHNISRLVVKTRFIV